MLNLYPTLADNKHIERKGDMKKVIGRFTALVLLVIGPLQSIHAQNSIEEFDEKFHIEKTIAERLEQTLKTRLDKKYFDITVEAKINRKNKIILQTGQKAKTDEQLIIEAMQSRYVKELNLRPFDLVSVDVTLSLAEDVNPKYRDDLNTWLQNWVKVNFNSIGVATVTTRPSDIFAVKEAAPVTNIKKNYWEKVERFQNLVGLIILGFFYAFGHFFMTRSKEKSAVQSTAPTQKSQPIQIGPVDQLETSVPQLYQPQKLYQPQTDSIKAEENIRKIKYKIAWLSTNLKKQVSSLVMLWLETESNSYLKIAAFVEALADSNNLAIRDSNMTIPKLPEDSQLYLPKALVELEQMNSIDRLNLYQEIYIDLVSKDLSDHEHIQPGFEFLANLTDIELQSVFDFIPENFQIRLLTSLPKSVRVRYVQTTDLNKLRHILNKSLTIVDPTEQQLLNELQAWQNKKNNYENSKSELISKIAKLRETCSEISRLEETLWVHQVTAAHPEMKEHLVQEKHHLCFITDWPIEKIRKFCLQTTTSDLASAMICMPFIFDKIMSVCGEQTKKELQVEMNALSEPKLSARFERFVNAFDSFVEIEDISYLVALSEANQKAS
jgi:hypothetical protein